MICGPTTVDVINGSRMVLLPTRTVCWCRTYDVPLVGMGSVLRACAGVNMALLCSTQLGMLPLDDFTPTYEYLPCRCSSSLSWLVDGGHHSSDLPIHVEPLRCMAMCAPNAVGISIQVLRSPILRSVRSYGCRHVVGCSFCHS